MMIDPLGVTVIGSALTGVGGIILGTEDDKAPAARPASARNTRASAGMPGSTDERDDDR